MITELLYYIFIFPLEQVLEVVLHNILKIIPSYGVSIILLSLVVNLFLLKIFLYTDKKAQQEADLKEKLDKRIKSWKSVYKRAKLYAFTQTLYRQHNYHPIYALRSLGGLALQIPFFFAMYEIINKASYLQFVSFLWIDDLSKPDSVSLFGLSIHILPLLMTAFTLINVFYSSKELGARIQGSLIALLFLVLLYSMPSALVLYWTCNMAFALFKEIFKHKKHSSLSNHSQDCVSLEAVITTKVTPAPKSTQNSQSNTAITRMCESADRVDVECQVSNVSNLNQDTRIADSQIDSKITQTPNQNLYKLIQYIIISLSFMICVSSPYALYVTDLNAFALETIPPTLAALFGFFILTSFMLIYIISFVNHNSRIFIFILWLIAWIFLALMLLGVSYGFVLRGDYGVMSHFFFEKSIGIDSKHEIIDGIMIASCFVVALLLLIFKVTKYIIQACKIFLAIVIVNATFSLAMAVNYTAERDKAQNLVTDKATKKTQILDFAKEHNNILVLILDRSDGYVVHDLFKENENLKTSFKGFIDFTNALSTSGLTLPTLTSIIAGKYYTALNINARNINDGLANEIARGYASTLNTFENAGYAVSSTLDFPTDEVHLYPLLKNTNTNVFDTTDLQNIYVEKYLGGVKTDEMPVRQLISYGLFRSATYVIRKGIYRRGVWLFSKQGVVSMSSLRGVAELNVLAKETTIEATKPTFKFIHNSITHNPYGLDSACMINPREIASPQDNVYGVSEGHYNSEKCAWQWVAQILERLQELGVYDNTEIFITADHGAQSKFLPAQTNFHIPLFYKPLHSKGEMRQDSRIITNYDIPALFCKNLKEGCPNINSITLDSIPHKRRLQLMIMGGGWNLESQNKNSFKVSKLYIFDGSDIYDEKAWQVQEAELK